MPESYDDPAELEYRREVESQLNSLRDAAREAGEDLAWNTEEAADHDYLYVPGRLLLTQDRETEFLDAFGRRGEFPPDDPMSDNRLTRDDRTFAGNLVSYSLPRFTESAAQDVRVALRVFDEELGRGAVTPEHYVHVAVLGGGRACPATEPEETGVRGEWPPASQGLGAPVTVTIVDTGWVGDGEPPMEELEPDQDLSGSLLVEYDGHGMFAEAVVRAQAPAATIRQVEFPMTMGAVPEGVLATAIARAIDEFIEAATPGEPPQPHIINLSAGCHTYNDQPLLAFEDLWTHKLAGMPNTVLVAAAGNDSSPRPFYPAASTWAKGVGALDRDDEVSSFSNYQLSTDVFILGRNHINRFPHGTYTCHWAPNAGDIREFRTCWARWSGTSFSTPLLSGLLAAHVGTAFTADNTLLVTDLVRDYIDLNATWRTRPLYGDHRVIARSLFSPP